MANEYYEDGTLTLDGKPVSFTIDWYVFGRTLGAMSDADRAGIMGTRGEEWHGDPDDGGEDGGLVRNVVMLDRYAADGSLSVLVAPEGEEWDVDNVSECLAAYGVKLGAYEFVENHDSTYTSAELERAGIIRPTGRGVTFGMANSRVMEFTEDYRPAVDKALAGIDAK